MQSKGHVGPPRAELQSRPGFTGPHVLKLMHATTESPPLAQRGTLADHFETAAHTTLNALATFRHRLSQADLERERGPSKLLPPSTEALRVVVHDDRVEVYRRHTAGAWSPLGAFETEAQAVAAGVEWLLNDSALCPELKALPSFSVRVERQPGCGVSRVQAWSPALRVARRDGKRRVVSTPGSSVKYWAQGGAQ